MSTSDDAESSTVAATPMNQNDVAGNARSAKSATSPDIVHTDHLQAYKMVLSPTADTMVERFVWWRILVVLLVVLTGLSLLQLLIRLIMSDIAYRDWWYLREATLNEEFARRPFMYDFRYYNVTTTDKSDNGAVAADRANASSSNVCSNV